MFSKLRFLMVGRVLVKASSPRFKAAMRIPFWRLAQLQKNRRCLISLSNAQNAHKLERRKKACSVIARLRRYLCRVVVPGSQRELPVPYGWTCGHTFAS